MRHIWVCIIDGCIVRSGPVQVGDTMPLLMDRMTRSLPHMAPDSLKVISEDGRVFDSELPFHNPTIGNPEADDVDYALAAVGIVEGYVGVKVHHGLSSDEVIAAEAGSFSGKITDNMDFGVFNFWGEQLSSIEDMIAHVGPENTDLPQVEKSVRRGRKARRQPQGRRSRGDRGPKPPEGAAGSPAGSDEQNAPQDSDGNDDGPEESGSSSEEKASPTEERKSSSSPSSES